MQTSLSSRELDGPFLTKYRMRPSIDYLERATQNETRQSFRRTTTEPSCSSAPSNLRGSGTMRYLKNLTPQYTGNSRLRLGEGNGEPEFRNNMGLLSSIGEYNARNSNIFILNPSLADRYTYIERILREIEFKNMDSPSRDIEYINSNCH